MSGPKPVKFADLPPIDLLSEDKYAEAKEAFDDAVALKRLIATYENDLDDVINRLERIQKELMMPGMLAVVDGVEWGFATQTVAGRRTLDKVLLMERAGVSKKVLDSCMKQGKESVRRTLKKCGEAEEGKDDRDDD